MTLLTQTLQQLAAMVWKLHSSFITCSKQEKLECYCKLKPPSSCNKQIGFLVTQAKETALEITFTVNCL